MTRPGMVGFRSAATLAHALPNVRLRIRERDRVLLEVARPPLPPGPWPVVTPCAFHAAVAQAYLRVKAGQRLTFLGLPDAVEVAIDVGLLVGDAVLPGDIYRLAAGEAVLHLFATTLEIRRCRGILAEWGRRAHQETPSETDDVRIGLHHDPATDISLVYVTSPGGEAAPGRELTEDLLAAFAAAELVEDAVGCTGPHP